MEPTRISVTLLVFLVLLSIMILYQDLYIMAQINPPYREGDWFRYRVEVKVNDQECWVEAEMKVLEIDNARNVVRVQFTPLGTGGSLDICSQTVSGLLTETTMWYDLSRDYSSGQFLIDPKISGMYRIYPGVNVSYDNGILRELKTSQEILGFRLELSLRLIDSSILWYKPLTTLLIVIAIIAIAVLTIAVVIYILRERFKRYSIQQTTPGPQPPQTTSPQNT